MRRVLLVDTNFSSWPILRALENWGFEVHVVGANPVDTLARMHPRHHLLDYSDTEALVRLVDELSIDHLVPGCNDISYISCAAIVERCGFAGLDSPSGTAVINNKALFRDFARRRGMSVPRVFVWPQEVPDCPVIVKPVDAFSGKGVTMIRQPVDAVIRAAIDVAIAASRSGHCIIEEFVDGQMYSHSAFLVGGRIVQDFWVTEYSSTNPYVVDTSCLAFDLNNTVKGRVRKEIESMAAALRLVDGLLHTQFIVSGEQYVIVEITRRCPGDLYSMLIELSTGYFYSAAYVAPFVDRQVESAEVMQRFIMRHTLTGMDTMSLEYFQFHRSLRIERWVPLASSGDLLRPSPLGRMAILFASEDSADSLDELVKATISHNIYHINH